MSATGSKRKARNKKLSDTMKTDNNNTKNLPSFIKNR